MNSTGWILIVILALLVLIGIGAYIYIGSQGEYEDNEDVKLQEPSQDSQTPQTQSPTQRAPQKYEVEIEDFAFAPITMTVKVGDTIEWRNRDSVAHTVTSDGGGILNSQSLDLDEVYTYTFTTPGTYAYHCTPHARMKATIVVEE